MNKSLTEIAFILDRSGSMEPATEAAIAGFNIFLREQQKGEGNARLTLVLFDDEYLVPVESIPVEEVVELDTTTYVARGSTALLDAMGRTIDNLHKRLKTLPEAEMPGKVVVAVFTDGLENASTDYSWQDVAKLIKKRREKNGWEFLFLGANQDAIATAARVNIYEHDSASVHRGHASAYPSSRAMSRKISAMRSHSLREATQAPPTDLKKSMSELVNEEPDSPEDD